MQSRDEIAEQVVALAGSVSNEKAERIRTLVAEAKTSGLRDMCTRLVDIEVCLQGILDRALGDASEAAVRALSQRLDDTIERIRELESEVGAGADQAHDHEERISWLEKRATENTGDAEASTACTTPRASEVAETSPASPAPVPECIDVVFDGPPSHESGRFVEVEDMRGRSVSVGEWIDRKNGLWALRIPLASRAPRPAPQPSVEEMAERLRDAALENGHLWHGASAHHGLWTVLAQAALRADKNTGEGTTSQTGAVPHSQSGGGSDAVQEPARSARIDDAGATQGTPSPASLASVPEWVPSGLELRARFAKLCEEVYREQAAWDGLSAWLASRAPRASTLSVEEMAERLYESDLADTIDRRLSALPAPDAPKSCSMNERQRGVHTFGLGVAPAAPKPAPCEDGLLPDGPVCPKCGGSRAPSGVGGGTWVHAPQPASEATTYYVGDFSTLRDTKPNIVKLVEEKPASEAQGGPTLEEITSLVHGGEVSTHEAWARCPECRPRAEKIRSLFLAHRAPSPFWTCVRCNTRHDEALDGPPYVYCHECAVRAPSPSPALAAMIDEADATMSRILGRSFARHLPSVPTSPALAALVEAGDAMAATLRLIRNRAPLHEDYQRDIDRDVAAYDRTRAALPKGGAA